MHLAQVELGLGGADLDLAEHEQSAAAVLAALLASHRPKNISESMNLLVRCRTPSR